MGLVPWLDENVASCPASDTHGVDLPDSQQVGTLTIQLSMGGRMAQLQRTKEHRQAAQEEPKLASPPRFPKPRLEIPHLPDSRELSPACGKIYHPHLPLEPPMETIQPEVMVKPSMATMCTTHIVQDETTGVTYMDTVTTSMGRVALGSSHMVAHSPRPTIEDVTDLCLEE